MKICFLNLILASLVYYSKQQTYKWYNTTWSPGLPYGIYRLLPYSHLYNVLVVVYLKAAIHKSTNLLTDVLPTPNGNPHISDARESHKTIACTNVEHEGKNQAQKAEEEVLSLNQPKNGGNTTDLSMKYPSQPKITRVWG